MKKIFVFLLFLLLLSGCTNVKKTTELERPDVHDNKVMLIVNGADVGITSAYTNAVFDAYFSGKISSASIFVPGTDADRAISILQKNPGFPIGIHLTLTGDVPPLTKGKSLRQAHGNMWDSKEQVAANVVPGEAGKEWEAQVRKVLDAGIQVSHMDSHMGCYFASPALMQAAVRVSQKYHIPLISQYYPDLMPETWADIFPVSSYIGIYTLNTGTEETPENRAAAYWNLFSTLTPGIHYLFTHPGVLPDGTAPKGDMGLRLNETIFWTSDETHRKLEEMSILVISSSALK